jgi:putative ABC transport system permease protein
MSGGGVRLGLLELRRSPRRTVGLTATVFALTTLVLVVSTISLTLTSSLAGAIDTMRADVVVLTTASQGTLQASRIAPETLAAIARTEGVARTAAVGEIRVTAVLDGAEVDASLFGIDPAGPGRPGELVDGRMPAGPGEVLADEADARRGATLGSTIGIAGTDVTLEIVGVTARARFGGILTMYAPYQTWEDAFGQLFPDATELRPSLVAVDAAPGVDVDVLATRISTTVDGVEARTPQAAAMQLPGMTGIRDSFRLLGAIAIGSALLLVGSFWLLTAAHQARALAVLRAAGVRQADLVRAVLVQVVAVVGFGGVLAAAVLWGAGQVAPPTYPLRPDPVRMAILAAALLVGALAAALPAVRRVATVDPLTALAQAER